LDPGDKVSRNLLEKKDLHIGHIGSKTAGQIEPIAVRRRPPMGAGAPPPVRVVAIAAEALRRPGPAARVIAKLTIPVVSAAAPIIPPRRWRSSWPVIVPLPATIRTVKPFMSMSASWAAAFWGSIPVVLFLLDARNLEIWSMS